MNMRRTGAAALILTAAMLAGCSTSAKYEPKQSGIYVAKDGTVQSAEIESFDNSEFAEERYNADELVAFVEQTVGDYNEGNGGSRVVYEKDAGGQEVPGVCVVSLEVKDGAAQLVLKYASCDAYMAFTQGDSGVEKLVFSRAPGAFSAGISLDNMKDPEGKDVDTSELSRNNNFCVVSVSGTTEVVVEGIIKAASGEVTVKDKHTAEVSGENAVILFK